MKNHDWVLLRDGKISTGEEGDIFFHTLFKCQKCLLILEEKFEIGFKFDLNKKSCPK